MDDSAWKILVWCGAGFCVLAPLLRYIILKVSGSSHEVSESKAMKKVLDRSKRDNEFKAMESEIAKKRQEREAAQRKMEEAMKNKASR